MNSIENQYIWPKRTLRIVVGLMFFLAGLCFASWASRIVTVQQNLGLSDAGLGAILFSLPGWLNVLITILRLDNYHYRK